MSEIQNGLPSGWVTTTLSELAGMYGLFGDGDWVESKDQDPMGHVRLIQLADVGDGYYKDRSDRSLTADKAEELGCTFLQPGDILISRLADPIGRACIFPGDNKPSVTVVDVAIFRSSTQHPIDHAWLKNWINASQFRRKIEDQSSGTTRKRISRSNLGRVEFPLPPLPEQQRIVAKIESLQARSDAAKQALDAIPPLLEKLRQSVLAAACGGKLTSTSTDGELPSRWRMARIDDLVVPGGIFDGARDHGAQTSASQNLRTIDYTTSGVRVVRLENLGHLTFIDSKRTFISEEKFQGLKQSSISEGDILIGSFIEDAVRVCVLPRLDTYAIAKADCFCVRVEPDVTLPEYLALQLASRRTHSALTERVRGVTRPRITTKHLRALEIPVCPLEEQAAIVKTVKKYFALTEAIEQQIQAAKAQAEALNQSILAKAFRGELVPQDPTDEPASVLLERIRTARKTTPDPKRPRMPKPKPKPAQ